MIDKKSWTTDKLTPSLHFYLVMVLYQRTIVSYLENDRNYVVGEREKAVWKGRTSATHFRIFFLVRLIKKLLPKNVSEHCSILILNKNALANTFAHEAKSTMDKLLLPSKISNMTTCIEFPNPTLRPVTWKCRMMVQMRPRVNLGLPSTMSSQRMLTSLIWVNKNGNDQKTNSRRLA